MNRCMDRGDIAHGGGPVWSLILANRDGAPCDPEMPKRCAPGRPLQYGVYLGTRSVFQHTLDRADMLAIPQRKVIVCSDTHRDEILNQIGSRIPGKLLAQPGDRNTASSLFLALTYVMARDHKARVVVYPSNHFVYPEDRFIGALMTAVEAAGALENHIVVLGYRPGRLESDCEWICPGEEVGLQGQRRLHFVRSLVENPEPPKVRSLMNAGALRNTMIYVGKAEALWQLGWRFLPQMMRLFQRLLAAIGSGDEQFELGNIYSEMPACSFTSDLLAYAAPYLAVLELQNVTWSQWWHVDQITGTLRTLGWSHRIPSEYLQNP